MIKYERGLILAGQAVRDELVGQGGHADLPFIEVDLVAREALLVRLESGVTHEVRRLHPSLEGKFSVLPLTIGGKSKAELLNALKRGHVNISDYAEFMVESSAFTTLSKPLQIDLAIGAVGDLVPNPRGQLAKTPEIELARGEKGLISVPAEAALHYLLQHGNSLGIGEAIWMSMNPIAGRRGRPDVLGVARGSSGLWLTSHGARPSRAWYPSSRIAFGLPQVAEV